MSKTKKYQAVIEQTGDTWTAQITRQITSKKTVVSKEQDGFKSESDAKTWADKTLPEFTSKQLDANKRQNQSRAESEKIAAERSVRRAEKTILKKNQAEELLSNENNNEDGGE